MKYSNCLYNIYLDSMINHRYYRSSRDVLKGREGYPEIICKYHTILYKVKQPQRDTKG